jgi:hypothetical protein
MQGDVALTAALVTGDRWRKSSSKATLMVCNAVFPGQVTQNGPQTLSFYQSVFIPSTSHLTPNTQHTTKKHIGKLKLLNYIYTYPGRMFMCVHVYICTLLCRRSTHYRKALAKAQKTTNHMFSLICRH